VLNTRSRGRDCCKKKKQELRRTKEVRRGKFSIKRRVRLGRRFRKKILKQKEGTGKLRGRRRGATQGFRRDVAGEVLPLLFISKKGKMPPTRKGEKNTRGTIGK